MHLNIAHWKLGQITDKNQITPFLYLTYPNNIRFVAIESGYSGILCGSQF